MGQTVTLVELNLRLAGLILTVLGVAHGYFPRRFGWRQELVATSPLSRQVHFVHNAYIGLTVTMNGLLCLFFAPDLIARSRLATVILCGMAFFWGSRLLVQIFVYDSSLWRGKPFEFRVHILFLALWAYLTTVPIATLLWKASS